MKNNSFIAHFILLAFLSCTLVAKSQTEPRLVLPIGHTSRTNSAIFSPNGKLVLTGGMDNTARLWDVQTGKELQVFKNRSGIVNSVAFSRDGKYAVSANSKGSFDIFDIGNSLDLGEYYFLPIHSSGINTVEFSSNSEYILSASDDYCSNIYRVSTGERIQKLNLNSTFIKSAVFSANGKFALVCGWDSLAYIFDINSGQEFQKLVGHLSDINSAVFNPEGNLALTSSVDHTARVFDVYTGKEILKLEGNNGVVYTAFFSADGNQILTSCADGIARLFNSQDGKLIREFQGNHEGLYSAVFGKKNGQVITSSFDGYTFIWNVESEQPIKIKSHQTDFSSVGLSENGKQMVIPTDNGADIYEIESGKIFRNLTGSCVPLSSVFFDVDSKFVLCDELRGNIADYFNIFTGEVVKKSEGLNFSINDGSNSVDSKLRLKTAEDGNVIIEDIKSGLVLKTYPCHNDYVSTARFCKDDKYILTASFDGTARLFESSSGNEITQYIGHGGRFFSANTNNNCQKVITAGDDNTSIIFDLNSGQLLNILEGHTDWVTMAEFSSSGFLALTASVDGTIGIWETESGNLKWQLKGHDAPIIDAKISLDEKFVFTTSNDYKSILWDITTGGQLYTRLQLKDNDWLVYDEDYRFDGTPGAIEKLYFTCGLEVIDLAQMKDSLWVPGLVEKIMNGQDILINDKLAPKLSDLNICDLTPVIEPLEQEDKKILKYRITPRNGGLGNTEVYINGNLTYSLASKQLKKTKEAGKEVYYLTLSTDTLQQYLTGKKNDKTPILVKSKVKGSGIYGRGEELEIAKTTDEEKPQFYGVFIGVNEYGNAQKTANETRYRNLDYAAKDANDLSLAVEKTAANLFKSDAHIYRLTGTGNEAPTKENLQRVLVEIGAKSKASDILYIFFAGHGDIKKGKNEEGQEQDQIRFMLMNADKTNPFSTSFGVEELTKWCSPQKIKAQKRVFVFDACHSGKIIGQTMAFNGRGDDEGARIRQLDKLKDKNGMMILAAAADDESAYEDETLNQGVLTYHLLQVMKELSDTSLVVRNWFDETIELVKDYSKANGNKQEPSSFGDGRFEIGNVNQDVREAIKITCPKTRVGACVFTANAATKQQFPNVQKRVNEYFSSNGRGDNLVFSKNAERAYHAQGLYILANGEVQITFDFYRGEEVLKEGIEIPIKKYQSEDEVVQAITKSITEEIEKLKMQDEKCKLSQN